MSSSVSSRETTERILEILRELPPDVVEELIERWMWELDAIWREDGIPDNIDEQIEAARNLSRTQPSDSDDVSS